MPRQLQAQAVTPEEAVTVEIPDECPECGASMEENLQCWQWVAEQCRVEFDEDDNIQPDPMGEHDYETTYEFEFHCGRCSYVFHPTGVPGAQPS